MALLCFHRSTINSTPYKIKVSHHKNNYFSDLTHVHYEQSISFVTLPHDLF